MTAHTAAHKEYLRRIHRAQDYIERHLAEELTLAAIAREACFSPYHFHRVFKSLAGETLYKFILRCRLERAAGQLLANPDKPVTDIALECGFSGSATFARSFKEAFGVSASRFRKDRKTDGKPRKDQPSPAAYPEDGPQHRDSRRPVMTTQPKSVEVRDLPAKTMAYLRHTGPYAGDMALFERLWQRFCAWAGPRGLFGPGTEMISIYHDSPEITEEEKLRTSLGCTVAPGTPTSGEINLLEIPAGRYACALFEIDPSQYGAAWNYVAAEWLPRSGYQPDEAPAYECYLNDPKTHPEGKHVVEIRIGVKPL